MHPDHKKDIEHQKKNKKNKGFLAKKVRIFSLCLLKQQYDKWRWHLVKFIFPLFSKPGAQLMKEQKWLNLCHYILGPSMSSVTQLLTKRFKKYFFFFFKGRILYFSLLVQNIRQKGPRHWSLNPRSSPVADLDQHLGFPKPWNCRDFQLASTPWAHSWQFSAAN